MEKFTKEFDYIVMVEYATKHNIQHSGLNKIKLSEALNNKIDEIGLEAFFAVEVNEPTYKELVEQALIHNIPHVGVTRKKLKQALNDKMKEIGEEAFLAADVAISELPIEEERILSQEELQELVQNKRKQFLSTLRSSRNELVDEDLIEVYDYAIRMFTKAFEEGGSLPLEHTIGYIEDGYKWKGDTRIDYNDRQQGVIDDILREAEKYSQSYMEEEDILEYYADDKARLAIIKEEIPHVKALFPTGKEIYLACYVHFDSINESIYTDRIYSYQGMLGNLLYHLNSGGEGDACYASYVRNDKVRYTFSLDKTQIEDEDYGFGDDEDEEEEFDQEEDFMEEED